MKITVTIEDLPPERIAAHPHRHTAGEVVVYRPNDEPLDLEAITDEVVTCTTMFLRAWGYRATRAKPALSEAEVSDD